MPKCQKRPIVGAKRPIVEAKETYCRAKRDLTYRVARRIQAPQAAVSRFFIKRDLMHSKRDLMHSKKDLIHSKGAQNQGTTGSGFEILH